MRFKAVDRIRRQARQTEILGELPQELPAGDTVEELADETVRDDCLRLIFTCCHPALAPDAQVALTLREVCGLTTEEVASAFLIKPAAVAAHRPRQAQDPRCAHSLRSTRPGRAARTPGRGAARGLSRLQRGLFGNGGDGTVANRAFR